MIYKYLRARKLFEGLLSLHPFEGMHELLAVGVEFQNFGLVKIEANYPIPSFNSLLARLEE